MDDDDDDGCRRRILMVDATSESVMSTGRNNVPIIYLDDDDDDEGMVNATSEQSSVMCKANNVPVICLDDDDKPDEEYKLFMDQLIDDISSGPLFETSVTYLDCPLIRFEDEFGESETRMFSNDSKISKLGDGNLVAVPVVISQETEYKNRVSEERGRRNLELKAQIERDNRVSERRKRKIVELEASRRDNKVRRKMSEFEVENLRDVTLVSDQEYLQQDNNITKLSELEVETLSDDVSLVSSHQRGNKFRISSEFEDEILQDVLLVSDQEDDNQGDNIVGRFSELEDESLSDVTLFSDQEYMQQDSNIRKFSVLEVEPISEVPLVRPGKDNIYEGRKSEISETMAARTSRDLSAESVNRVTVPEAERSVERRKKNVGMVDKDYMSYLTWLVDTFKDSITTKQRENLQNDQSHLDPPVLDALKESTVVPEKEPLLKVKEELVFESWSDDDDDIIAVSDSPFLDGEGTPFVVSKSTVDLDKEGKEDGNSHLYKKKLTDILKKPYDERELRRLSKEVSMKRWMTRFREFRRGREKICTTSKLGQSYLERYSDFDEEYKLVKGVDKAKALTLLRGFFFYLENVSHDGAFKPWDKNKQHCLQP